MNYSKKRLRKSETQIKEKDRCWGSIPKRKSYETLVFKMVPVLNKIKKGAIKREIDLVLPHKEIIELKATGFSKARLPESHGGINATLPELFELLISLAEADPNVAQVFRSHFGFTEHILTTKDDKRKRIWLERLSASEIVASASSEGKKAKLNSFNTTLHKTKDLWFLNGEKAYATGAQFADWIEVEAKFFDESVGVMIHQSSPGLTILNDWDGMGQRLSGNDTVRFKNLIVKEDDIVKEDPFPYYESFYQLFLLAIMAGIARSASNEASEILAIKKHTFSHAPSKVPSKDSQLLQVIGEVRSSAYAAGAIVMHVSKSLEKVFEQTLTNSLTEDTIGEIDIEVWQAQHTVKQLVLSATTKIFDIFGGSSTLKKYCLDRHWRNARTLASHNPSIYKSRIVGNFAVNGILSPGQWSVGIPEDKI